MARLRKAPSLRRLALKASAQLHRVAAIACDSNGRPSARVDLSIDEGKVSKPDRGANARAQAKNFKESDRIRDELAAMGVVLKDSKDGTTWEIAR